MKRTFLRNFKQVYRHPQTKEEREYNYQVVIVKDTNNYEYRILNITSGTLWKDKSFKTFDDALMFLNKHPHCTNDVAKEIQLDRVF